MKTNHIKSTLLAGCLIAASVLLMLPAETAEALSVTSISFGDPPDGQNDTYKKGDAISIKVVFSEAVTVTGAPYIDFLIYNDRSIVGPGTIPDSRADYSTGTGTDTLTFTYTVAHNKVGTGMLLRIRTGLQLNGGRIHAGGVDIVRLGDPANENAAVEDRTEVDGRPPEAHEPVLVGTDSTANLQGAVRTIFTVEFTFSEVVSGFEEGDILLENTAAEVVQGSLAVDTTDAKKYTAKIRVLASGVVHVSVPANSATDAAGNGNRISFTLQTPAATVRIPTVGTVKFTTTGPYTVGNLITISVEILHATRFSGSPTLKLDVGGVEKTLTAPNVTGSPLEFTYTVVAGDEDTDGVDVKANSLTVAANTIEDGLGSDLLTTFAAVRGGPTQTVNAAVPTVGTISFTSTGPYKAGEAITVSVPILNATQFSGSPTLKLDVGGVEKTLTAANVTASPLVFTYNVVAGDTDTNGVDVKANSLTVAANTIEDADGNDLVTTFAAVAGGNTQVVDTTAPTVGTISFGGTGPYKTGDAITISVPLTDASAITLATGTGGSPTLVLTVGTTDKTLTSSTSAGTITALAFSYTVAAGDADADGVSVKANSLTLPSGTTVRDAAGNDLTATFTAVNGGPTQTVDTAAPTVGTIAFTSTGPYTAGDTITISVPITDTSAVTLATGTGGAPTLKLVVGTTEKTLTSSTSAGTITALAFSYRVVAGDTDTDGISVKANSLTLPSGTTIRDAIDLDLVPTFTAVNGGPSQTVDTTAPTVGTIAFTSTGPYKAGDAITISVPLTDASAITLATGTGGAPTLKLVVGTTERTLTSSTSAGTITALAFSYTVVAGDTDTDGVSVKANSLTLPSGTTVRDAVDLDLVTTFTAVNGGSSHAVDNTAPTVGAISFTGTGPYTAGIRSRSPCRL